MNEFLDAHNHAFKYRSVARRAKKWTIYYFAIKCAQWFTSDCWGWLPLR